MSPGRYAGGSGLLASSGRQPIERAHDRADRVGGHPRVDRGGVELGVPEQHLDHADVDVLLEQVGGEAVAQRVRRHPLLDLGQRARRHARHD